MLRNVFLIAIKTIINNRKKYYVSWIAFSVISIFMVVFFSFGTSSYLNKDENKLSARIVSFGTGTMNRAVGENANGELIEASDLQMLSVNDVLTFGEDLKANNSRCMHEGSVDHIVIDGKRDNNSFNRCCFYCSEGEKLLFDSEIQTGAKIIGNSVGTIVTENFLKENSIDLENAVGTRLTLFFTDEMNREERLTFKNGLKSLEISVDGVIKNGKASALNSVDIYIPASLIGAENFVVDKADIELKSVADFEEANDYLSRHGQRVFERNYSYDLEKGLNNDFRNIASSMSFVLIGAVAIGFLNTNIEVIESNKGLFNLLKTLGSQPVQIYLFTFLLSFIQGFIGVAAGCAVTMIIRPAMTLLLQYAVGDYREMITVDFSISPLAVLYAFICCISISVICGLVGCIMVKGILANRADYRKYVSKEIILTAVTALVVVLGKTFLCNGISDEAADLIFAFVIMIVAILLIKKQKSELKGIQMVKSSSIPGGPIKYVLITVVLYFAYKAMNATVTDAELLRNGMLGYKNEEIHVFELLDHVRRVLIYGIWCVLAEEMLFRRYLYTGLRKYGETWAVCVTSALFGIMHGFSYKALVMFVLSYVLCIAYERTGKIRYPILLHSLWNLLVLITDEFRIKWLGPESLTEECLRADIKADMATCLLVCVIFAETALLIGLKWKSKKNPEKALQNN